MTYNTPTLYLAWQDERTRTWFTVGRLRSLSDRTYEFVYTRGYDDAHATGMQPIIGFDDSSRRYVSEELFPLFQNRLMSKTREDYRSYLSRLGLADQSTPEPLVILALSGGRRNTDSFYLFPSPTRAQGKAGTDEYHLTFFVHGVSHVPASSQERIARLVAGDRLRLMWDWQNPHDDRAIMLRSDDNEAPYLLGWVPRFYRADLHQLREKQVEIVVTTQRVNSTDAPSWSRLLCNLSARWPDGLQPFSDVEYQPLAALTW